jgi:hypothetical protein
MPTLRLVLPWHTTKALARKCRWSYRGNREADQIVPAEFARIYWRFSPVVGSWWRRTVKPNRAATASAITVY